MSNYNNSKRNGRPTGRAIDAVASKRLLNWTNKYNTVLENSLNRSDPTPNTPSGYIKNSEIMFSESPIHNKPFELFEFYNDMLGNFGQDSLKPQEKMITAQAGLEALAIMPIENYKIWYEYIANLMQDAVLGTFEAGNRAEAARWQAHLVTLSLHKYIAQVKNVKNIAIKSHKNSAIFSEISRIMNSFLRDSVDTFSSDEKDEVVGVCSELTILSALGNGRLFNQGMFALPSYEWEDSSLTKSYSGNEKIRNGFDIKLYNYKNGEETKLQIKTSSKYSKEYSPGIAVINCDEIVKEYREQTGLDIGNIWKLSTLALEEYKKNELLNFICDYILRKKEALKPTIDPRLKILSEIEFNK
jgi:hypothetical protein